MSWDDFLARGAAADDAEVETREAALTGETMCDIIFTQRHDRRAEGRDAAPRRERARVYASWADVVGLRHRDRYLLVYPLFHTAGLKSGLVASLLTGTTLLPHLVFDTPSVMATVQEERITMLPGPPAIYQTILNADISQYDFSSLRLAVTGAAVVPVELVVQMREQLGLESVVTGYGLTETTGIVSMCRHDDDPEIIAHTSGRPIPGVEMKIVDADGNEVPTGEQGEIVARGFQVMIGYFDNPEATAETIDADGWLHTGDVGLRRRGEQRHHHRPHQGHVHRRRVQRVPGRDRGPDARPSRSRPGRDRRRARRAHGRGGHGVRRADGRPHRRPRRGAGVGARAHGELQGAAPPRGGRRAAVERQREGA